MDGVKESVLTICVVLVVTEIIVRVCPKNSMIHFVRALIVVVLLISAILGLFGGPLDFPAVQAMPENTELTEYVEQEYREAAETEINRSIISLLAVLEIKPKEIQVFTDINDSSGIVLTKVIVTVSFQEEAQRAKILLASSLGEETAVEVKTDGS